MLSKGGFSKDGCSIYIQVAEPFLPVEEYARRTGETVDAVRGQIRRGRLPIRSKVQPKERVYVNMTALHLEALGDYLGPDRLLTPSGRS